MLRTLGFASAPGVIRVLGVFPVLGPAATLVAMVWMLLTTVVAVLQALDYQSTGRAVGVCMVGWILNLVVAGLLFTLVYPGSGG